MRLTTQPASLGTILARPVQGPGKLEDRQSSRIHFGSDSLQLDSDANSRKVEVRVLLNNLIALLEQGSVLRKSPTYTTPPGEMGSFSKQDTYIQLADGKIYCLVEEIYGGVTRQITLDAFDEPEDKSAPRYMYLTRTQQPYFLNVEQMGSEPAFKTRDPVLTALADRFFNQLVLALEPRAPWIADGTRPIQEDPALAAFRQAIRNLPALERQKPGTRAAVLDLIGSLPLPELQRLLVADNPDIAAALAQVSSLNPEKAVAKLVAARLYAAEPIKTLVRYLDMVIEKQNLLPRQDFFQHLPRYIEYYQNADGLGKPKV